MVLVIKYTIIYGTLDYWSMETSSTAQREPIADADAQIPLTVTSTINLDLSIVSHDNQTRQMNKRYLQTGLVCGLDSISSTPTAVEEAPVSSNDPMCH